MSPQLAGKATIRRIGVAFAVVTAVVTLAACNDGSASEIARYDDDFNGTFGEPGYRFDDPDVEIELVAGITEVEVAPGEFVEAWTYNGQYPGPELRVKERDKVRVTLRNDLPEATAIHWHGLDVPNPEDGVPNITQPMVEPGETWTYEFIPERVGTTAYHTHANTLSQLGKGMFGALIVEERTEPEYDHDYVLALHEIGGFFTINGKSFPLTVEDGPLSLRQGETARIRFVNMGAMNHPMHLHGHQFEVISIDGNTMPGGWLQNTIDVPPGQTADVVITGDNPGTWTFHCHIISHVTTKGVYPGGMLTLLDYEDHTSYFEEQGNSPVPQTPVTPEPDDVVEPGGDGDIVIRSTNSLFDAATLVAAANQEVTVVFDNADAGVPHNIAFYTDSSAEEEIAVGEIFPGVEEQTLTFTAPEPGTYFFRCDVHPATMVGDFIVE